MTKKTDTPTTGAELAPISDKQMADQLAIYASEWGSKGPSTPEIKISYADDETKGKYIVKRGDETELIGDFCNVIIMKSRNQYSLYNEDKEESMKTDEFDDFKQMVSLRKGGKVILNAPYQDVKLEIKSKYPDMKFINILYVYYKDIIHKIYVKPGSRQGLWDFQANTSGRASFSFNTTLGVTTNKKGSTTYYPMTFQKGEDMAPEEFKTMMALRIELDKTLVMLTEANEKKVGPTNTDDLDQAEIVELFS